MRHRSIKTTATKQKQGKMERKMDRQTDRQTDRGKADAFIVGPSQTRHAHHKLKEKQRKRENEKK